MTDQDRPHPYDPEQPGPSGEPMPPPGSTEGQPPPPPPGAAPAGPPLGASGSAPPPPPPSSGHDPANPYQAPPLSHQHATESVVTPAGAGVRFGARLLDGILLAVINLVIAFAIINPIFGNPYEAVGLQVQVNYTSVLITGLVQLALVFAYFVGMETTRGQTFAKMMLGLKVVGPDGGNPTAEQSMRRNSFYLLNLLLLIPNTGMNMIASVIMILVGVALIMTVHQDPEKQGWHDKFAGGTRVLKINN